LALLNIFAVYWVFKTKKHFFIFLFVWVLIGPVCQAQQTDSTQKSCFFVETEGRIGWLVANHSNFPESSHTTGYYLNIGQLNSSSQAKWASFYNFPYTGISLSAANLGNDSIMGNQYTAMPYIAFNTANRIGNAVYFRLGLGCSYFTKHYNRPDNRMNRAIGSHYTWSFQAMMYYSVFASRYMSLQLGWGYLHSSNGHTQLPNIGLNQGVVSLSAQFYPGGLNPHFCPKSSRVQVNRDRTWYYMVRNGFGFHEYGNAGGPVGGQKRMVKSLSLSTGLIYREHIKAEAGIAGRFYNQYYYHILNPVDSEYFKKPVLNSSCVYVFLGCEFLMGHIGMDIEGGVNIYKPFYERHYTVMEGEINTDYWLKRLINTKMGLNYYLINTDKNPRTNLFVGATINANFGQADFSEACIGIVHSIGR
jgi:hypothetical protein